MLNNVYLTWNYTVTLKPGLQATQGHRNHNYRSATYDILLTFHSKHGPISYRIQDKRRFPSKIAKFSHPMYLRPTEGVPLGIRYRRSGSKKTKMTGLPGRERSLTISSAVWIQDGRTDGRTPGRSKDRVYA